MELDVVGNAGQITPRPCKPRAPPVAAPPKGPHQSTTSMGKPKRQAPLLS
jgi:hypothetical protein